MSLAREKYIGIIEVDECVFTIVERKGQLIAGTTCNAGLIEHHVLTIDDAFSLDENLQCFIEEIEEAEQDELSFID